MRTSERICRITALGFAFLMSCFGTVGTFARLDSLSGGQSASIGSLAMTTAVKTTDFDKEEKAVTDTESKTSDKSGIHYGSDTDTDTEYADIIPEDTDHSGEETFLVTESLYRESNMSCENFYVKNATDISLDLRSYLNGDLPFTYEDTDGPQVLIVHTHATESYMDSDLGYYYESFYPRSTDDTRNVISVGDAICKSLESSGIKTAHCTVHHDDPSYLGAYDNCAASINEYLEKYPSVKIVLDIHRDSITTDDGEKIKPTFTYGGEKAAQIMIMCGNDNYGYYDFPNWEQNMTLAVKLQSAAETAYPGMTRPLYFGNFMYNMNLAPGSLLIEVGTDANTHAEAVRTGAMLGNVIAQVLKNG